MEITFHILNNPSFLEMDEICVVKGCIFPGPKGRHCNSQFIGSFKAHFANTVHFYIVKSIYFEKTIAQSKTHINH